MKFSPTYLILLFLWTLALSKVFVALGMVSKWVKWCRSCSKFLTRLASRWEHALEKLSSRKAFLQLAVQRNFLLFPLGKLKRKIPPFNFPVTCIYRGSYRTFAAQAPDSAVSLDTFSYCSENVRSRDLSVAYLYICLQLLHIHGVWIMHYGQVTAPTPQDPEVIFPSSISCAGFHLSLGEGLKWVVGSLDC